MTHLLVTNDFPPKIGGIQSYLWELWRRLPDGEVTVLAAAHDGAGAWDDAQPFRVIRSAHSTLLPSPAVRGEVLRAIADVRPGLVLFDPAFPLGAIGPAVEAASGVPFGVVLHGAEVTIPGRLPITRSLLARTLAGARLAVCAGGYPAAEAERAVRGSLPRVVVPPGVDAARFAPGPSSDDRAANRRRLGLPDRAEVVLGVSRLVPRKGFDVLVRAAAALVPRHPHLHVAIAGAGRDRDRLERIASRHAAPVTFLGRVDDADLADLYACADVFAMLCRDRWFGLEQEGFGIVFLEAAAAGLPAVAGRSGGAHEAVVDESTGLIVAEPSSVMEVAGAIGRLLDRPEWRQDLGQAARRRAVEDFDYARLATHLLDAVRAAEDQGHAGAPSRRRG